MSFVYGARALIADMAEEIRSINRRYSNPRLKTSPAVGLALLALRIYLLLLVALLAYKFVTVVAG